MTKLRFYIFLFVFTFLLIPKPAYAMHIMEGFLPVKWCIIWGMASLPFIFWGLKSIEKIIKANPRLKMLLAVAGAFTFVLSALKMPSVTGSCSHPTGIGLGTILFGPAPMVVLGTIVLIFQALLLAHGGLTTLGANIFSMAIVGAFSSYGIFKLGQKLRFPLWLSIFLAASIGDLLTYVTTSIQLSLAFPAPIGGFYASVIKFMTIYAVTQVPLAISEGILTVIIFNILTSYNSKELQELNVLKEGA